MRLRSVLRNSRPHQRHVAAALAAQLANLIKTKLGCVSATTKCRFWVRETPEDEWQVLPHTGEESLERLEAVAKDHPVTELLLEEANSRGEFPRKVEDAAAEATDAAASAADSPEWRASFKVGMWLDAQDTSGTWLAAKIEQVVQEGDDEALTGPWAALKGTPGAKIEVRFDGWSAKYNEWFAVTSAKLLPLHTHSKEWRSTLRPLSELELMLPSTTKELRWYLVKIRTIDRSTDPATLTVEAGLDDTKQVLPQPVQVSVDSMDIAAAYTHLSKPAPKPTVNMYGMVNYRRRGMGMGMGSFARHRAGRPHEPGTVGLDNLGNTCFMNSMLQCLNACEPLTQHFLDGKWEAEVNPDNVLGQGGRIASAYAALLEAMWSGKYSVCSPSVVKSEVGRASPQFQGFQQHDSQELMSFLLDGIHEDLNRILKKPYVEDVSSLGRPDPVVALEAWRRYKMRNDSVVVDTFTGQFRSHLTCNMCGNQSITFDPFTSVSVPVSEFESKKTLVFTFTPADPALHCVRYRSFVPKHGVLGDIVEWLTTQGVYPLPQDIEAGHFPALQPPKEEGEEDAAAAEGDEGKAPSEEAPAAAAAGGGAEAAEEAPAAPTVELPPAEMICVKVDFRSHCIASFCDFQDSIGDIRGNDWMYVHHVPKPDHPDVAKMEAQWAAKMERAQEARALQRSDRPIPKEAGETDADIEELLAFHYIENRPYVIELRMRQKNVRGYGAGAVGYGLPELVSLPALTGSLDESVHPTGRKLHEAVWTRMTKYLKKESLDSFSLEELPYKLSLAPVPNPRMPGTLGAAEEVPCTDDVVELDRYTQVLVVDWADEASSHRTDTGSGDMARQDDASYGDRVDKDDHTSVTQCLDRFVSREQLGSNDMWFCPKCKQHVQAYKEMSLYSVPDVLVVHLKRFHVTNYGRQMTSFLSRSKLDNFVEYPLEGLDISKYVSGPQPGPHIYDCFAVSDHMGGMGGGHYVASAKNFRSGKWYSCNDSSTSPISEQGIVSRRNYVLFFRRRTPALMATAEHLHAAAAAVSEEHVEPIPSAGVAAE